MAPWHHVGVTKEITLDKNWIIAAIRRKLNPITCKDFSWRGSRLSPVPCRSENKIAGTFAQQLGWVFVGPCHPSAHGPPAKLRSFTSFQMVHTHTFTLYTHDFLYTDAFTFTHKRPYTQTHLHRDTFTHRRLYPRQRLRSRFYTRTLLQTDAFAHRGTFYTQTLVHKCLSTQTP